VHVGLLMAPPVVLKDGGGPPLAPHLALGYAPVATSGRREAGEIPAQARYREGSCPANMPLGENLGRRLG
jgi:hypothetical protein